ncbi:MAG: hypothetical protein ACK5LN_06880 [Propioniciclava sp.]
MRMLSVDRDDRGQALSSFFAVVMVALFLTAGLVIDGGAKSAASRVAHGAAAEAARAAVDAGARARAGGRPVDLGAVQAAGRDVLTVRGVEGAVTVRAGRVKVTTAKTVDTLFLGLVGVPTLTAHAEASAMLLTP